MSALSESGSPKGGLYCESCDYVQFPSYNDWHVHHLHHLRQPVVRLVKLNSGLSAKLLQGKSYRVNTGVARSSQHQVPPLKISLIKEQGGQKFTVKRKNSRGSSSSSNSSERTFDPESGGTRDEFKVKIQQRTPSDVEGKDLLERLGANFLISRRGKPTSLGASGDGTPNVDSTKEKLWERLSGIGGISISPISKPPNTDSKPLAGISISTKEKCIELRQLKKLKNQVLENDKKGFDENKILEKLSGSGLISIASKPGVKEEGKDCREETPGKGEWEEGPPRPGPEALERLGSASGRSNRSEDSNDSSDSKMSGESRTSQVNAGEENGKTVNENSGMEQKKFVRVKQSSFSKKNIRMERQGSQEEASEERAGPEEGKEKEKANLPEERGIDILERLTENLNNSVRIEQSAEAPNSSDCNSTGAEDPLATVGDGTCEEVNRDISASESECLDERPEPQSSAAGEKNTQEREEALLLTSSSSRGQDRDRETSNYSGMGQGQQESYEESDNVSTENNDANESAVTFTSLSTEDQSEGQGEQQTAFWSDIQNPSNSVDQPQEDPLLTPENSVPNGDTNFMHNFSNEYQTPTNSLPHENSEFMSLDRLGQTQHQHPSYSGDPSGPMEHLNQQVQRIPNPTPQINVISQHHLQAPPPPQLHTGVPLSPQHISPQQANSYDTLHMQPPMPPPLYQGFMYNQSYPPQMQRPPQPQMPMLQQRPHIPTRTFQSMPVPQQRPRPRLAVKRSPIRPPTPQEMVSAAKQPRMTSLPVRSQVPPTPTKLPSGITITPPKKTLEANKVANVLASRGITVTPSRQAGQGVKPQQPSQSQQQQQRIQSSSSVLNISSAVSITPPNQSRSSGGFAVPGPRRSAPIVNHNAERPERCMTVDLTQDDEIPHSQLRGRTTVRFPCNLCGKMFASPPALATHKNHHRDAFPFKCDICSAEYYNMSHLITHRQTCHKKAPSPDLAIPIVDLNHPGARDELRKCGIHNFIPLAQLQSNTNGYFGVPIIQLDTAKEKAVSNLSLLGAGNILVLGKMKAITTQSSH